MRILVAPDKFKHALTSRQAARAIADGIRDADPTIDVDLCPMADGGEGTGELLAAALHAMPQTRMVRDPLARSRRAQWWWSPTRRLAIVELAQAAGHSLLTPDEYAPFHASTYGVGELIVAAREAGAHELFVALGGSATVDGGAGLLQALGWRLFDVTGREMPAGVGGGALARVSQILPAGDSSPMRVTALVDVQNPLIGPRGAAMVFGPQKGASPSEARELDEGLRNWCEVLQKSSSRRDLNPGTAGFGAAGGVAVALRAAFDATIRSGFETLSTHVGLDDRLAACDLCLTGEGRLDVQTAGGKVVSGLARRAKTEHRQVVAFVGQVARGDGAGEEDWLGQFGLRDCVEITPPGYDLKSALADTEMNLRIAVGRWISQELRSNSRSESPI
ncbi:MAG: glycerate kinase [Phycisphaerae bacterium]|nr:glycerate kinase [Phycisphaerae bacterium]